MLAHILVTELLVSQYFSASMPIAKPSVVITNTRAQIFSIFRSFGIMHQPACNAAEKY
jgi:hypothetical protein